jgi:hypothetical protein
VAAGTYTQYLTITDNRITLHRLAGSVPDRHFPQLHPSLRPEQHHPGISRGRPGHFGLRAFDFEQCHQRQPRRHWRGRLLRR